jgi:hypothetical protein
LPGIELRLPLPWLHIAKVVADEAVRYFQQLIGRRGAQGCDADPRLHAPPCFARLTGRGGGWRRHEESFGAAG